jgi:D-alanine-D-alanine ligase
VSRVAVLKGGRSLERGVSLRSGARVEDALQRLGHDVLPIDVGADLVQRLRDEAPDAAFIALHGRDGEDGTVQELLEILGIPYTGSGVSACIRCSDKVIAKHVMRDTGIPTPDFFAFNETAFGELGAGAALPAIEERLAFPIVVKPASQGSALGIKFARTPADVPAALVAAFSYDRKVLLERYVAGRDLAVSVIDAPDGGGPIALPIVEAVPREDAFYDFESRYEIGRTTFVCPAELPAAVSRRVQQVALDTYRTLGCRGFARIDLMLERERTAAARGPILGSAKREPADELVDAGLYVLEAEIIPGLTETSLLPLAADAAEIDFDELMERMLASAALRDGARAAASRTP